MYAISELVFYLESIIDLLHDWDIHMYLNKSITLER